LLGFKYGKPLDTTCGFEALIPEDDSVLGHPKTKENETSRHRLVVVATIAALGLTGLAAMCVERSNRGDGTALPSPTLRGTSTPGETSCDTCVLANVGSYNQRSEVRSIADVMLSRLSIRSADIAGLETVTWCADPMGLNFSVGLKGTPELSDQMAQLTVANAGRLWKMSHATGSANTDLVVQRQGNSWMIGTSIVLIRAMQSEKWFERTDIVHLPLAAKFSERQLNQLKNRKGAGSSSVANATGVELSLSEHAVNVLVTFSDHESMLKGLETGRLAIADLRNKLTSAIGGDPSAVVVLAALDKLKVKEDGTSVRAAIDLDREQVRKLAQLAMGVGASSKNRPSVADREHPYKSVRESVTVRHFAEVRFVRRSGF